MNIDSQNPLWDQQLKDALGKPSPPDFDAWRNRYPDALEFLNPKVTPTRKHRWGVVVRVLQVTAMTLLLGVFTWFVAFRDSLDRSAYAQTLKGLEEATTMTWTTTAYLRTTSEDGKRRWLKTERIRHAYRAPGLYRETRFDDKGEILWEQVVDARAGKELYLNVKDKTAVIRTPAAGLPDLKGPFTWVTEALNERVIWNKTARVRSLSLVEQKTTANGSVNVIRAIVETGGDQRPRVSYDFWIDAKSKQLVAIHAPGADEFDPTTDPDRNNPREEKWSRQDCPGSIDHEIVLNANLDPDQFSLSPPAGFKLETADRPTVTEQEMVEYLGAAAEFEGGVFPDSPYGLAVNQQKFNEASSKAESDRTPAEQKLIELRDKILFRDLFKMPTRHFEEDRTIEGSFRYIGAGVKLGAADRLVCWYRLRESGELRAVYGDLKVKKIAPEDLPFDVQ